MMCIIYIVTGVFIKDKKPIIVDERRDRSVDLMIFDKRSSSATSSSTEPSMPKFYPLDASHGPAMALLSAHLLLEPTPPHSNTSTAFPYHQYLQQQQQQPQSMYYCTPMLPPMPSHTPQIVNPLYSQPPLLGYYPTPSPQSPLHQQQQSQLSTTPLSHTRRKPVRPLYQQHPPDDERQYDTRPSTHHYQQQEQSRQHRIPRKQPQYKAPSSNNSNNNNSQSRRVRFANTLQVMTYDAEEEDQEEEEEDNEASWDDIQEEPNYRRRNDRVFGLYTPSARKRSHQYAPSTSYY